MGGGFIDTERDLEQNGDEQKPMRGVDDGQQARAIGRFTPRGSELHGELSRTRLTFLGQQGERMAWGLVRVIPGRSSTTMFHTKKGWRRRRTEWSNSHKPTWST